MHRSRIVARTFLALALAASSLLFAARVVASPLDTVVPAAEWTKTIGTLRVEKYGAGEPALILVPGLGCGSWTYRDTIAREAPHHAIYAVTLAGFDGVPYDRAADTLDAADASILALIAQENIVKPVLVGHSMGGFLALRFGEEHSDLVRSIVSIDGLPILPDLALDTPAQLANFANGFAKSIRSASEADYEKTMRAFQRDYVTSPALADAVATLVLRSDRNAIADYGRALFESDLRPQLEKLTAPTIVMAPVPALPLPSYYPVELSRGNAAGRTEDITDTYKRLTGGAAMLTIAPVQRSRHFVMLDRPDDFGRLLDAFIAAH